MKNRVWVLVLAGLALTGCIKSKTLVVVNPDGSGSIVVETKMSPQMAQMVGGMADSFAGAAGGADVAKTAKKDPLFDEEQLKKDAAKYGEGVSFAKARKAEDNGWRGSFAVYSFADITKVKIPLSDDKKVGPGGDAASKDDRPKKFITFAFAGGATKTLTVNVPQEEQKTDAAKPKDAKADASAAAMMGPVMGMLQGMEVGIAIKVKGEIVKSNATNKDGTNGVVIMHMDADKMKDSPKFAQIMQSAQGGGDMPMGEMIGMPGFQFETNKVVEVQFN